MRQGALKGDSKALMDDEEAFNDDGMASKGNWEAFKAMKRHLVLMGMR